MPAAPEPRLACSAVFRVGRSARASGVSAALLPRPSGTRCPPSPPPASSQPRRKPRKSGAIPDGLQSKSPPECRYRKEIQEKKSPEYRGRPTRAGQVEETTRTGPGQTRAQTVWKQAECHWPFHAGETDLVISESLRRPCTAGEPPGPLRCHRPAGSSPESRATCGPRPARCRSTCARSRPCPWSP